MWEDSATTNQKNSFSARTGRGHKHEINGERTDGGSENEEA